MKTAILLATNKNDKLDSKVLGHGRYTEILAEFKRRVREDIAEPGYDSLELWTGPAAKRRHKVGLTAAVVQEQPEKAEEQKELPVEEKQPEKAAEQKDLPVEEKQPEESDVQGESGESLLDLSGERTERERMDGAGEVSGDLSSAPGDPSPGSMAPKRRAKG